MASSLPDGPLIAFYGDDFTGSTAVLEALAFAGLPTFLYFSTPDAAMLAKAGPCRAIGIAGLSRSQSPLWMDTHLRPAFEALKAMKTPLVHYKICSTFDSAPETGSIGRAADIAATIFAHDWIPVLTAAPQIARWQAFGNLFAGVGGETYRIDRHPVMMRHPATPMTEGDLRRHLALQTETPVGLIDLVDLKAGTWADKIEQERARGAGIVLLDMIDEETLERDGAILWGNHQANPFVIGSQGVEQALIAHWRKHGLLPVDCALPALERVDKIAAVSGSCSSVTGAQIAYAGDHGFALIKVDPVLALDQSQWEGELSRCFAASLAAFEEGRHPLLFTAQGPHDPSIAALAEAIATRGADRNDVSQTIGAGLGRILDAVIKATGLRRVVVSGGDSSGQACLAMGLAGVTALAPLAPSAPLCRALSNKTHLDGLEIALKGGQMGPVDFFCRALGGG